MTLTMPLGPLYTINNTAGWKLRVELDGVPQMDCIEAHTVEGRVTRFVRAANGQLLIDGESIRQETVYGKVDVIIEGRH